MTTTGAEDLDETQTRARDVEHAAANEGQRRRAVHTTSKLMLAAVEAGWKAIEIATVVEMKPTTVRRRVAVARDSAPPSGLDVPGPPRPPNPLAVVLSTPIEGREWLTWHEAMALAGISHYTLRNWRTAGLLPNCEKLRSNRVLILRADLLRVMNAPRYHRESPSYASVRAAIAENGL